MIGLKPLPPGRSAEVRCPAGVHQQFLLRREGAEQLEETCFLFRIQPITSGKVAYAQDLLQAPVFQFRNVEM